MLADSWLRSKDPGQMLKEYRAARGPALDPATQRRYLLLGCGCCRTLWNSLGDPRCRLAVETAERIADGEADPGQVESVRQSAMVVKRIEMTSARQKAVYDLVLSGPSFDPPAWLLNDLGVPPVVQTDLIRCILGNPFRAIAFDPAWRTSTCVALAEGVYTDRAFDRMPILADALEEAGCSDPNILDHARGAVSHARGCWVVDWLLQKS